MIRSSRVRTAIVITAVSLAAAVSSLAQSSRTGWGATPYAGVGGTGVTFRNLDRLSGKRLGVLLKRYPATTSAAVKVFCRAHVECAEGRAGRRDAVMGPSLL